MENVTMSYTSRPGPFYAGFMLIAICSIGLLFISMPLYGALALIPLGAWQVLDAVFRMVKGDKRRDMYLITTGLYLLAMLLEDMFRPDFMVFKILFQSNMTIVIPFAFAFWYWFLTNRDAVERSS